jgi:hypothetical protein
MRIHKRCVTHPQKDRKSSPISIATVLTHRYIRQVGAELCEMLPKCRFTDPGPFETHHSKGVQV